MTVSLMLAGVVLPAGTGAQEGPFPPAAPTDVDARSGPEANITVNWTAPGDDGGSPITNYTVWRGEAPEALAPLANSSASETTYLDSEIQPDTTYYYALSATNEAGDGELSEVVNVTTPSEGGDPGPSAPSPPEQFSAEPGPGQGNISLSWDPPLDDGGDAVTHYTLYRGTSADGLEPVEDLGADQAQYLDEGLTPDQTYHYELTAHNGAGESDPAGPVDATAPDGTDGGEPPQDATVPSAPQNLSVTPGPNAGDLTLTWDPPADDGNASLTGYRVYRGQGGQALSEVHSDGPEQTQYVDQALTDGNYTYAVSAQNAVGEGALSEEANGTVSGDDGGSEPCDPSDPSCGDDGGSEPCDPSDPSCGDDGGSSEPCDPGDPGCEGGDDKFGEPSEPEVWFGGVVNITVTRGGEPVSGEGGEPAGDVFVMPAFNPDSDQPPPPCEDPDPSEETRALGTCTGTLINATTGVASLSGLADGTYDMDIFLFAGGGGFYPSNFTIDGATVDSIVEQSITIELPEPGWVTGIVVDGNGQPVENAFVELFGPGSFAEGNTDANGAFNLSMSPGEAGIYVQPPSDSALKAYNPPCNPWDDFDDGFETCVTVEQGSTVDLGTIALGAGGAVSGRLVDSDGNGLQGNVEAFQVCEFSGPPPGEDGGESGPEGGDEPPPEDGGCEGGFGFTHTEPDGTFTLSGLATGTYVVQAFIFDHETGSESRAMNPGVSVTAGNTTEIGDLVIGGGGTITGQVTGPDPVPDVEVGVFQKNDANSFGPGMPLAFGFTDDEGRFSLDGIPPGDVSVEFFPSFDSPYKMKRLDGITVADEETTWLNASLSRGKSIRGVITDADGDAVGNADVGVFPIGPCPPDSPCGGFAFTNDAGEYTIGGLGNGSFGMFVGPPSGSGLSSAIIEPFSGGQAIQLGADDTTVWQNVTLQSGGQIRGNVTNAGAFAWVSVHGNGQFGGGPVEGGTFSVDMPPGTYTVTVEPDFGSNFAPAEVSGVTVAEGNTTWVDDITLDAGACISGTVEDGSGGLQGAFVDVFQLIPPGSEAFPAFGFDQTDADGAFQVCGLKDGDFGLHVEPPFGSDLASYERVSSPITLSGEEVTLDDAIVLAQGVSVRGDVTDADGNEVTFGFAGLWNPDSGVGSGGPIQFDGSFRISIQPGTYDLEVMPDPWSGGNLAGTHCQDVTVAEDGAVTVPDSCSAITVGDDGRLAIQLSSGGTLTGRLLDANGDPVSYAFVDVKTTSSFSFGSTSSEGNFRVPGIVAEEGETVEILVGPPPGSTAVPTQTSVSWSPDDSGLHDAGNLTLSAGASLVVTVQDANGDPVADAEVDAWPTEPMPFGGRTRTTDANGQVTLRGLPDATYDVAVFPSSGPGGFFPSNVTISSGTDASTTLQLRAGASLTVTVTDGSSPLQGAVVDVFDPDTSAGGGNQTDASGQALVNVPEGTYTVRVMLDGYRTAKETEVAVAADGSALAVALTEASVGAISATADNSGDDSLSTEGVFVTAVEQTDAFNNHFNLTDATGNVTLSSVPVGTYVVFATVDGDEVGCQTVEVTADTTVSAGALDLTAACNPDVSEGSAE